MVGDTNDNNPKINDSMSCQPKVVYMTDDKDSNNSNVQSHDRGQNGNNFKINGSMSCQLHVYFARNFYERVKILKLHQLPCLFCFF